MEELREKLKRLEKLSLDPFKPEALREELEELMKSLPEMSREELEELALFLQKLKMQVEENYRTCFGWVEFALKGGFRREV
ncbi:MAG: hypothetical protein WHS43_07150 [Aquificaceae bacterium]|uniref:hypothetical protein n=1 Tax=Hydrogenobacter sp. Uz 6-8 TaxID=3384828 RepID=UPI003094FB65